MLPQITQLSTAAPSPDASQHLSPSNGEPARLSQREIGQNQTANFAAVFSRNMPGLQNGTPNDVVDQPQVDVEAADEGSLSATQKQAESAAAADKEANLSVSSEATNNGNHLSQPPTTQDDHTENELTSGIENPLPSGNNRDSALPTSNLAHDPWQVAVLPKGAVPEPLQTESFATIPSEQPLAANPVQPVSSDALASEAKQSTGLNNSFKVGPTEENANPVTKPETNIAARFAEPTAPLAQQPGSKPPMTPQVANVDPGMVAIPGSNSATSAVVTDDPLGPHSNDTTTIPKPNGSASAVQPTSVPLAVDQASAKGSHGSFPNGHPLQPLTAQEIALTPVVKSTETLVPSQGLQNNQTVLGTRFSVTKNSVGQTNLDTAKATAAEPNERISLRSEPVMQGLPPSPMETTKLVSPLMPLQAIAPTQFTDTTNKDAAAVDPFGEEAPLSLSASTSTAPGSVQRSELPPQIARQLAEAIQQNPNRQVEITLKPQELGAVRLSVQQAEAGIIVTLTAERPETLDLMRRHVDQLGQEFQAMGYANIAFSFAGSDAGTNAHSEDTSASGMAETEDSPATPATHIHLGIGTTGGVDLRI